MIKSDIRDVNNAFNRFFFSLSLIASLKSNQLIPLIRALTKNVAYERRNQQISKLINQILIFQFQNRFIKLRRCPSTVSFFVHAILLFLNSSSDKFFSLIINFRYGQHLTGSWYHSKYREREKMSCIIGKITFILMFAINNQQILTSTV